MDMRKWWTRYVQRTFLSSEVQKYRLSVIGDGIGIGGQAIIEPSREGLQ